MQAAPETARVMAGRIGGRLTPNVQRWGSLLVVLLGIWLEQFVLYGPSLVGTKILLPLDILAEPAVYLPRTDEFANIKSQDSSRTDLVLQYEPERRFAVAELAAGRFPMWLPYQYTGVPARLSPLSLFFLLKCSTASPIILAWAQLLQASIAGLGAYVFFRRAVGVGFWAAAIPAWCYPLSGFFVLWQGAPASEAISWFPWMLLAVDLSVRRPGPFAAAAQAFTTCMPLVSGFVDVGCLALIASGIFALWKVAEQWRQQRSVLAAGKVLVALTLGWILGFCLAAPHLLPAWDYARTSARVGQRTAGREDRPPVGLSALPQAILPDIYGTTQNDTLYLAPINQAESAAAAYAGFAAALVVAPLAWCSRRHRSFNWLCALLVTLGLGWCLNLPGLVAVLRLPGLHVLSFNRFAFVTGFAILAQAAIGLEILLQGPLPRRWWFVVGALGCAGISAWCFYRAAVLPEPIATQIDQIAQTRGTFGRLRSIDDIRQVQSWFRHSYTVAGALCGLGVMLWLILLSTGNSWPLVAVSGVLLVGELLCFAYNHSAQCDPALYYPPIPALDAVAKSTPGRVVGSWCMPPNLAQVRNLQDIRGYDAFDPGRLVQLVRRAADPRSPSLSYAALLLFSPALHSNSEGYGIGLSPILDMLAVRYVVFRGSPPSGVDPDFSSADYWVLVNRSALPRVSVPQHVEVEPDDQARLSKLAAPEFDPRAVAYVETAVALPAVSHGAATIRSETPTNVVVSVEMETAGLLVLSDLWHPGWRAYVDGRPAPILRTNHAVRGVVVPAGSASVEFRYEPATFSWGVLLCGSAVAGLLLWSLYAGAAARRPAARSVGPLFG